MNDLMRPAMYEAWHQVQPLQQRALATHTYDIVGPICESGDWLARSRSLAIAAGDYLAIMSAGAYGMTMASNYNTRGRAAEVIVDRDRIHWCASVKNPPACLRSNPCFHWGRDVLWQARFYQSVAQFDQLPSTQVPGNRFCRALQRRQVDRPQYSVQPEKTRVSPPKPLAAPSILITFRSAAPTLASIARTKPRSMKSARCWSICPATATQRCPARPSMHWQELLGDYVQQRQAIGGIGTDHRCAPALYGARYPDAGMVCPDRQADPLHLDQSRQAQPQRRDQCAAPCAQLSWPVMSMKMASPFRSPRSCFRH